MVLTEDSQNSTNKAFREQSHLFIMASELGYLTASKLRTDAGLDTDDTSMWDDAALDVIITASETMAHIYAKKPKTTPWTDAEDIYEVVQRYVSADARMKMFSTLEDYEGEFKLAQEEEMKLRPLLQSPEEGGDGYSAKTSGANLGKSTSSDTTGTFT